MFRDPQINLYVADVEASVRFYCELCGFAETFRTPTDDVDGAFALMTSRGARPLSEPHDFLAHLRSAWVADPDGNPIQLVTRRR